MDEKLSKLFLPLIDKLYNQEPAGEPFRKPVDVVKYGCIDYYHYIKHPIDLTTIRERLTNHQYQGDAWRLMADIQLMFSNAYLFNKRGTPVYEFTKKLNRIWTSDTPAIMQKLNYCCGELHKFGPQLLFCHGTTPDRYCQISVGARYKCYQDQYSFCISCFNKKQSDSINIQDLSCETTRGLNLPKYPVPKSDFIDCANDSWQYEPFIQCTQCSRRVHQVCELYPARHDQIQSCLQHQKLEQEQKLFSKIPSAEVKRRKSLSKHNESYIDVSFIKEEPKPDPLLTSQSINEDENQTKTTIITETKLDRCLDCFVCNYCYRKKKLGFKLRHRKYSARRLPQTPMSNFIETRVNDYIKEHAPSTGQVTIRILAAYKDTVAVKPEMQNFVKRTRDNNLAYCEARDYPDEFNFTNRAIFAWQEIDGVDVCVFGMHVQEYGKDCPEPNRQVVYLSYLDSVHFFRPKTVRTAVYHEILLSYFKYVREIGFRRVFIWVCPSRKGDDYIFYRHPTEQKMPTLKRLADWYTNLLDKGIMKGIIEKHETLHQFFSTSDGNSILNMPYLSGDFWPGEFERLLKTTIESQNKYDKNELLEEIDRSLKRQREGFMVARLNDCDCSPHFESGYEKGDTLFSCNLMNGREPFLQLARFKNYEFSTLRRAKFSSIAMTKHLTNSFDLTPICHECFSFDTNKCHLSCNECYDYYLCTSCYENVHHEHDMQLIDPIVLPDSKEFVLDCSSTTMSDLVSCTSSTMSEKSLSDFSFDPIPLKSTRSHFNIDPNVCTNMVTLFNSQVMNR